MGISQLSNQKKFFLLGVLLLICDGAFAQSESKVYITKTGAKYHRSNCRYAPTECEAILNKHAERKNTACKVRKQGE